MKGSLLLVEDDTRTRLVMTKLLRSVGLEVDSCASAAEAMERLSTTTYQLLLTDHIMPGMTGLELARVARNVRPSIRCVVVSGAPEPDDAFESVTWLCKPLDFDRLLDVLADQTPSNERER
jgi:DNA-binding NtrC family response regulator